MRFAIVTSTGCAGFILARRPGEFEPFGPDEKTLGTIFETETGAVTAILQRTSATKAT